MDRLDRSLRDYCEKNKIFGVMHVTRRDEVLYEGKFGFADLSEKREFTDRSAFSLYSLSKPFCALGFLRLVEKGLVSLEDHPSKVISQAKFHPRVTFRNMLNHTSGLPDFVLDEVLPREEAAKTPEELRKQIAFLSGVSPAFLPEEGARYSNVNFLLTAVAIENITDMPYADYMQREVFRPLGMESAVVDHEGFFHPHRVTGYLLSGTEPIPTTPNYDWILGAGDMIGTVRDVFALHTAVRDRKLISSKLWDEVLTPSPLNQMGLGCTVKPFHGKMHVRHNGGSRGFRTLHIQLPEDDFGIIFLSNSGYGDARRDLADLIYGHFYGEVLRGADDTKMDTGYAL